MFSVIEQEFLTYISSILSENTFYFKTDKEYIDFSDKDFSFNIEIYSRSKKIIKKVDSSNFDFVHSILKTTIFNKKKIICWNIKNYFSYYRNKTGRSFSTDSQIFDLKVLERISGKYDDHSPNDFKEALNRFSAIYKEDWHRISELYKDVHCPLMFKVIPSIETKGIVDKEDKIVKYCYYEIEGQENGRLSSFGCLKNNFLPLNLKEEDKLRYRTPDQDQLFLLFDYKNMEVSVLEYLTKDPSLKKILSEGDDFYESLYKKIINPNNFDVEKRKKMKMIFLPFVYGAGNKKISETCNIELSKVEIITKRIKEIFPQVFSWLDNYSKNNQDGYYVNTFGKKRKIEQSYKSINFIVQSTASIFCLDKLIDLHSAFKRNICFYVHDAYCLYCDKKELESNIKMIKNILLQDSKFLNNINLSVSCKYGSNLNEMVEYEQGEHSERYMQ
jgi:hypothetical protein